MNPGTPILLLLSAAILIGQRLPVPPQPPGGPEAVRLRLDHVKASGEAARSLIALARIYLQRSEAPKAGDSFASAQYLAAADALIHAVGHQQHISIRGGPPTPDSAEIQSHLEHVYFRLRQADYFVKQSADANAKTIAAFGEQYYQDALRALGRGDLRTADECAKSSEDLMRALENLAQSTAPPPPRPPKPETEGGPEKP